jgi:hypothetical protein
MHREKLTPTLNNRLHLLEEENNTHALCTGYDDDVSSQLVTALFFEFAKKKLFSTRSSTVFFLFFSVSQCAQHFYGVYSVEVAKSITYWKTRA